MSREQEAGKILGKAFEQYPLMQYAFEGKSAQVKQQGLLNLYTHCTYAASKYGGLLMREDRKGALIWLPGKAFPLGLLREIQSGMAAIPFKLGPKTTLRLMNHDAVPEGWIAKNAGPHMGYIWVVGVSAAERGNGYSRELIEQSITDMKAQGLTEYWLKTEDPKNVGIYQKLGFKVENEVVVKSSGIRSWMMKRV